MSYIPKEHHQSFRFFKYTGGSDSFSYKYLWSPFGDRLVTLFPPWVAPNLITFIGLLNLLVVHVLFLLSEDELPKWKLMLMSASIIIYQHLDNVDGKQARRTKSSNTIGMLFDHGTDVFAGFFIGLQTLKFLRVINGYGILAVYAFVMGIFFVAMWMQYSTGILRLGRINPVDEGLPAYALLALVVAYLDDSTFKAHHVYGTMGEEFILVLYPFLILLLLHMGKQTIKKSIKPKSQILTVPLLYVLTGAILLGLKLADDSIYSKVFYHIYYILMFLWARNMILIQLYFISRQKYRVLNRGTNLYLLFGLIYIMFANYLPCEPQTYFLVWCILQGLSFGEFAYNVCRQGCQILDIKIFSITNKNQ